jgi:hypothetical protein
LILSQVISISLELPEIPIILDCNPNEEPRLQVSIPLLLGGALAVGGKLLMLDVLLVVLVLVVLLLEPDW